ncbi:MAG: MoaD/ThiS family protein [Candidatus Aminicenantes bacterium]|nr:MoaD/ThiS family protein [Candidatus Aminicenantes bacterium]
MDKVKVKFFAYFRELFGAREMEIELKGSLTLAEFLDSLAQTPQQKKELFHNGHLNPQVVVMVNGSVVNPEAFSEIKLESGSTIAIFPMMGGG